MYNVMKKCVIDFTVSEVRKLNERHVLLKAASHEEALPEIYPGQFAQLSVEACADAFLRRPISIHFVDEDKKEVWFLVQKKGSGTAYLSSLTPGAKLNVILPLGNGFSLPKSSGERPLLVGGGVGIAPLLYYGKRIRDIGFVPTFLLGARTKEDLLLIEEFEKYGPVYCTTEDGSDGEKGFVTQHSVWQKEAFSSIHVCGPKPMMVAVARLAKAQDIFCEVSLENSMACGVGACLCCVEDIEEEGNVCVCKEGPVFNINKLKWQI